MAINLNNFVDMKMKYRLSSSASLTRDTAILIVNGREDKDVTYSSLNEALTDYKETDDLYYYLLVFFKNNGVKLRIITKKTDLISENVWKYTKAQSEKPVSSETYYKLSSNGEYVKANPKSMGMYKVETFSRISNDQIYYDLISGKYYTPTSPLDKNLYFSTQTKDSSPVAGKTYFTYSTDTKKYTVFSGSTFTSGTIYYEEFKKCYKTEFEEGDVYAKIVADSANTYSALESTDLYTLTKSTDTNFIEGSEYATSDFNVLNLKELNLYTKDSVTETVPADLTSTEIQEIIEDLPMEQIAITSNVNYGVLAQTAINHNKEEMSIYQKQFISSITEEEYANYNNKLTAQAYNFCLKYGKHGIEMAIAAYLTRIDIDAYQSVKDYAFTTEQVSFSYYKDGIQLTIGQSYEDNDLVTELMNKNINVNSTLVNEIRNLGGNDTKGNDLVNQYMLILVHQTLTERLIRLLSTKLFYNSNSISLVGATISSELERYTNNGYLTTDKVWTEEDLVYKNNTIISKNTALKKGYIYKILPFSTLTESEKAEHKLPEIYILLADSYSIRKITITGEVF